MGDSSPPGGSRGTRRDVHSPELASPRTGAGRAIIDTKRRILVVDDNLEGAEILSIMLEHFGHDVRITSGGEKALEIVDAFCPHLVLLDLDMPRLNGFETCRLLREKPGGGDMIIAALTGWERDEDRDRTRAAGFDMHLAKPLDPDTMRKILEELPPIREA